uniref:Ribonuclease H1 n=1 Tax=Oncorhynchus kisutch TaxID=8019 RepID=A0A8C7IIL3_ONCKI
MFRLPVLYSIIHRAVCIGTEEMVKGKFFYAVRKGLNPGVYQTWDECKKQIDRFPHASYKKFAAEKDAWAFVRGKATSITPDVSEGTSYEATLPRRAPEALEYIPIGQKRHYNHVEEEEEEVVSPAKRAKPSQEASQDSCASSKSSDGFTYMGDAVVVYTDGCCSGNGKAGARAGIGVYWGRDHPLDLIPHFASELAQAACKALEQAKEMDIKKLVLYTDSKFTINGMCNWKLNNWRLKSGGPIINREDFEKLDKLNEELKVVWLHIPGHAGYLGNEEADRLSREGAAKRSH